MLQENDKTSCTENTTDNITRFLQLKIHQNITDVLLLKTEIIKLLVLNLAVIAPHIIISDFLYQNCTNITAALLLNVQEKISQDL